MRHVLLPTACSLAIAIAFMRADARAASPTPSSPSPTPAVTSPPAASAMVIGGQVPVSAGAIVRAEVLDPSSLQTALCDTATTTAGSSPSVSNFTLTVSPQCVQGRSGNIRVCWSATDCSPVACEIP